MDKDKLNKKGELNISIFARALACLVKCSEVSFGINKEKEVLLIKDERTSVMGEVKFNDMNKAITDVENTKPSLSKVREIITTVREVAPHLNTVETDLILLVLMQALERLEKEAGIEEDDIHDLSE